MTTKDEKTYDIVEKVLATDLRARRDDKWLTICVLRRMGVKIYIPYKELAEMPSFSTIPRFRRKIQHDKGLYLPSEKVLEGRQIREEQFRRWIFPEIMEV